MAPPLTELIAPGRCALVMVEAQAGVIGPASRMTALRDAADEIGVLPNLIRLAASARQVGVPVIHATAACLPGGFGGNSNARLFGVGRKAGTLAVDDQPIVQPVDGLFEDGDIVLPRYHGLSPMTGTQLDSVLRNAGISAVIATGVSLNVALSNLVFDAINRSYQVVVPIDAVAGVPASYGREVIEHTMAVLATLTSTDELVNAWDAQSAG